MSIAQSTTLTKGIDVPEVRSISVLGGLQKLGKALMLPIAVLPIAGLLLRLGSADVFDIKFMMEAGGAIFKHLALLFAVGVGIGLSKDNAGAAGLAGAVGYLVLTAAMKTINETIDMGVLAGILSGVTAGLLYNRFYNIKLPDWLAFFGGRRFVPIVTAGAVLVLAGILGVVWPPIQAAINLAGQWMLETGAFGAFAYGTANRLLIPTGLHQVLNSLVWFVFGEYNGATGDLHRFFAGDPTAGTFMAGFFPVMMVGLPAACYAMYRHARFENRKAVAGVLFGVGLTSFVTGVTEPVEFLFMFLAPALYLIHALLTGLSLALCWVLGIKAGFTFSGGAIDFVLNYGLSTNGWMLIPLSAIWGITYYGVFSYFIRKYNLKTPGREDSTVATAAPIQGQAVTPLAAGYIAALGGATNIVETDCCVTRLRMVLRNPSLVDERSLKELGAKGVVRVGDRHLQVIVGTQVETICEAMKSILSGSTTDLRPIGKNAETTPRSPVIRASEISIHAPLDGRLISLGEVPDPVFSDAVPGDGVAIMPESCIAVAPCDGVVEKIFRTNHAFALRSDEGAEILVHIGIDTVNLKGEGFTRIAKEGQRVKKGDPILSFDRDFLASKVKSLITPIIVTNPDAFSITYKHKGPVLLGKDLAFRIEARAP